MWEYNYTDELYHYGVPGMRWGHRRNRLQRSRNSTVSTRDQMSRYLKKDHHKISNKDARQFRRDAMMVKLTGSLSDKRRGQVSKKYEEAVYKKVRRDQGAQKVKKLAKAAVVTAGIAYLANRKKINSAIGGLLKRA